MTTHKPEPKPEVRNIASNRPYVTTYEPASKVDYLGGAIVTAILLSSATPLQAPYPQYIGHGAETETDSAYVLLSQAPSDPGLVTRIEQVHAQSQFEPRTSLGRRLMEIRARALAAGMRTANKDEILAELKKEREER